MQNMTDKIPSVLVPLAQGCEELEAITIIDLLRRANISVTTASLDKEIITASRGNRLIADSLLSDVLDQSFDMIVLPGGLPGADHLNNDQRIISLLKQMAADGKYTAAICAAPKVLASAELLNGKSATCYPGTLNQSDINICCEQSVVIDDHVITSRGPGTAMDFTLTLIEILTNKENRDLVETALRRT